MSISSQVENDLKTALKSRDQDLVSVLRLMRASLQSGAKDARRELAEDEEIAILKTMAKQRRESIEKFRQGGREDLAGKEEAELAVVERYLPAQMDEKQIETLLDEVFAEVQPAGMKDMGRVMKEAMARLGGRADGKLVNQLVRGRLAS